MAAGEETTAGDAWRELVRVAARRSEPRAQAAARLEELASRAGAHAAELLALLAPVALGSPDRSLVLGQLGQTLDGRIATVRGESRFINGRENLTHLHRLRALVDVVVVGCGTVLADDPRLTVRHVDGASPARAVIDVHRRCPGRARVFAATGGRRLVLAAEPGPPPAPGVEVLTVPAARDGHLPPRALLGALAHAGLTRVLVEGGGYTVSAFLQAGCLDRLHACVAPVLLGSGRPGLELPAIDDLADALRPPTRIFRMGADVLFDCDLRSDRPGAAQ
ncbi:MAG: RibD family protein [Sandaracinaceae bacterium]